MDHAVPVQHALPEITESGAAIYCLRNQAEPLRRKLADPGPIRLSDVEAARRSISEIAVRILYAKGKIALGAA